MIAAIKGIFGLIDWISRIQDVVCRNGIAGKSGVVIPGKGNG
jgi:hypothetical protein